MELADTLDLGSSARAWGFKSLKAHQKDRKVFFYKIKALVKSSGVSYEKISFIIGVGTVLYGLTQALWSR